MHKIKNPLFLIFFICQSVFSQTDTIAIMKYIQLSKDNYGTHLDSAEIYANEAIKHAQLINFNKGLGYGYSNLGIINEYKGDYTKSILYYEKSKEVFTKGNITKGIALSNQNLGVGYFYLTEYEKSLTYYFNSLKSFKKLNYGKGIASVNNNIGAVYEARKDFEKALSYYQKAHNLKVELNIDASSSLGNIANIYCEQHKFTKGLDYYLKAEKEKIKFKSSIGLANLYSNISGCYVELNDYNKAENYIVKAIKIDTARNNMHGYAYDLEVYGDIENSKNNIGLALEKYNKSYQIASKNNYLSLKINSTKKLSDLYVKLGNYKKALSFHQELLELKNRVLFEENKEAIANLEVVYKTEEKAKEIELLNSKNTLLVKDNELKHVVIERNKVIRIGFMVGFSLLIFILFLLYNQFKIKSKTNAVLEQKNTELNELNATKDKLFSIVAHDLKNPVFAFKNMTESMSKGFDKIPKEMMLGLVSQLRDSSIQLFDLLTNLLSWSNSQGNNITVTKTPFYPKQQVDEIISLYQISSSEKLITINNKLRKDFELLTDKEIVHTALRNIVMNAIKFTPKNGVITIYKRLNSIVIEDNGIGMSEEESNMLFDITQDVKLIGNSSEKGTGLGLILCKELLQKANVTIHIESKINKGTKVILGF